MSIAIYRKYRPSTFADVTSQEHVKRTLMNQLAQGNLAHAYLFTGPRGVGKTTIARLLAKAVNCEKNTLGEGKVDKVEPCNDCAACKEILEGSALDVYEIDAASHTDVENVRENIIKSVRFAPNRLKKKVYIIDEVHMLSSSAFNALLKTLEEPPEHALFILATTEIHKVPQTIISRCQRFDFRRIPVSDLMKRLEGIAKEEKVEIDQEVLAEVARHADGCARDAESLLGQILALGEKHVTLEEASLVLPATSLVLVVDFIEALVADDVAKAVDLLNDYVGQGVDMQPFASDVISLLRDLLLAKLGGEERLGENVGPDLRQRLRPLLEAREVAWFGMAIEVLLQTTRTIKSDVIPQLGLELAAVKIAGGGPQARRPAGAQENQGGGGSNSSPSEGGVKEGLPANEKKDPVVEPKTVAASAVVAPVRKTAKSVAPDSLDRTSEKPAIPAPPVGVVEEKTVQVKEKEVLSEPIAVKETVMNDLPVVDLSEIERKWPEVSQKLAECNASLPLIFQSGKPVNVQEDCVEVGFEFSFHAETVNQDKNRRLIEQVMEKVFGKVMRVKGTYVHTDADETVSQLLNEFGGNVA